MKKIKLKFGLTPTQWDKLCKRCGECCRLDVGYCQYLWFDENKKACCTVFKTRLGRPCGDGKHWCNPIDNVIHRPKGCPYNKYFGETKE
jgi:uncharacterized cysteine cluster protein YcgN (CxxCxxCC family)